MTNDQEAHQLVQEGTVFVLEPYEIRIIFGGFALGALLLMGLGGGFAAYLSYSLHRRFSDFMPLISEHFRSVIRTLPLIAAVGVGVYFLLRFLNQKLRIVVTPNFLIGPRVISNQAIDIFRCDRIAIRRSEIDFSRQKVKARKAVYLISAKEEGIAIFRHSTPTAKINLFEIAIGHQLLAPIGSMKRQPAVK